MPGFDGIGANEYIVDVTHPDTVDFISAGDTPYIWELNIWYHTLNVGFPHGRDRLSVALQTRASVSDVFTPRLMARSAIRHWLDALRAGRSYVSDGRSHLMDFTVNRVELGTHASEVKLARAGTIHARVRVSAYLPARSMVTPRRGTLWMIPLGNAGGRHAFDIGSPTDIHDRPIDTEPYWHIERARIKRTRQVPMELVMNGNPFARKSIVADGTVQDIAFDVPVERSSWMAAPILGLRTAIRFLLSRPENLFALRVRALNAVSLPSISAGHKKVRKSRNLLNVCV